jgi:hypothetical protein
MPFRKVVRFANRHPQSIVYVILVLFVAILGAVIYSREVTNSEKLDRIAAARAQAAKLHLDSCRLANVNRSVIRANVAQNYADSITFLRQHPKGIPGLFSRAYVLNTLTRLQRNYKIVWPVDCRHFVAHPNSPPKLKPLPPLAEHIP